MQLQWREKGVQCQGAACCSQVRVIGIVSDKIETGPARMEAHLRERLWLLAVWTVARNAFACTCLLPARSAKECPGFRVHGTDLVGVGL